MNVCVCVCVCGFSSLIPRPPPASFDCMNKPGDEAMVSVIHVSLLVYGWMFM